MPCRRRGSSSRSPLRGSGTASVSPSLVRGVATGRHPRGRAPDAHARRPRRPGRKVRTTPAGSWGFRTSARRSRDRTESSRASSSGRDGAASRPRVAECTAPSRATIQCVWVAVQNGCGGGSRVAKRRPPAPSDGGRGEAGDAGRLAASVRLGPTVRSSATGAGLGTTSNHESGQSRGGVGAASRDRAVHDTGTSARTPSSASQTRLENGRSRTSPSWPSHHCSSRSASPIGPSRRRSARRDRRSRSQTPPEPGARCRDGRPAPGRRVTAHPGPVGPGPGPGPPAPAAG